jgi:hypothetical protein
VADPTRGDLRRCPHCGGLNARDADWCGQCARRFKSTRPIPKEPPRNEEPGYLEAVAEIVTGDDGEPDGMARVFSLSERGATWVCATCSEHNEMSNSTCSTCGHPFRNTARLVVEDELAELRRERESGMRETLGTSAAAAANGGPFAIPFALAALLIGGLKALLRVIARRARG